MFQHYKTQSWHSSVLPQEALWRTSLKILVVMTRFWVVVVSVVIIFLVRRASHVLHGRVERGHSSSPSVVRRFSSRFPFSSLGCRAAFYQFLDWLLGSRRLLGCPNSCILCLQLAILR